MIVSALPMLYPNCFIVIDCYDLIRSILFVVQFRKDTGTSRVKEPVGHGFDVLQDFGAGSKVHSAIQR